MADIIGVKGLGAVIKSVREGNDLIVVLLKAVEADADLRKHATLADVLGAAGNTEADFTDYERKVIANASITVVEDASGQPVDLKIGNITWFGAGNGVNNNLVKLLVCKDGATDADRTFYTAHDFTATTDGNDLIATEHEDGFFSASQVEI